MAARTDKTEVAGGCSIAAMSTAEVGRRAGTLSNPRAEPCARGWRTYELDDGWVRYESETRETPHTESRCRDVLKKHADAQ